MGRRDRTKRERPQRRRSTEDEVRYEEYPEALGFRETRFPESASRAYNAAHASRGAGRNWAPPHQELRPGEYSDRRRDYRQEEGLGLYGQEAGYRELAEQRGYAQAGYGGPDPRYDIGRPADFRYGAVRLGGYRQGGYEQAYYDDRLGHAYGGAGIGGYVQGAFGQNGPIGRELLQTGTERARLGRRGHESQYGPSSDEPRQGGHRGRGPRGYQRSDQRILDEVCDALHDDDYVDAQDMEVRVENGEVILTGTAPDRFTKRRAEEIADHCPGVHDVHNQLRVKRAE